MLQYTDKPVTLKLTREQFLVIYEMLYHTKLGSRNFFEEEISDLMIEMENNGAEYLVNEFKDAVGEPQLCIEFNSEDGFSLSVDEK